MGTKQIDDTIQTPDTPTNTLAHYLIVRHAFGSYRKGDAIRDEATITAILADAGNAANVHKVVA
jgi:hypothetical protein